MIVGIYKRKLVFFSVIGLLLFGAFQLPKLNLVPEASATIADYAGYYGQVDNYQVTIDLQKDGTALINGNKVPEGIKIRSDREELRYIVLDSPSISYPSVEVTINLPKKLSHLVAPPEIIAVHGNAAPAGADLVDDDKIIYRATNVSQTSTVTVVAGFPRGYFNLPATTKVSNSIESLSGLIWIILGIALPPIAALLFLYMTFKSDLFLKRQKIMGFVNRLPTKVSPAIVEAIINGRVGPRTIMATLVDLSQRGFIKIYNKGKDFVIYRDKLTDHDLAKLKPYEQTLIEKIFLPSQTKAGAMDVEARTGRHLFSRKIALFYLQVYEEATSLGYFSQPPQRVHLRYRLAGIAAFFWGLIGYAFFAFIAPDPKFVLFFWLALVFFGILIVNFAPRLTAFTAEGHEVRKRWLQFKNFLNAQKVIQGEDELYEKYLPYSVALGAEVGWSARFAWANFTIPEWYSSASAVDGVDGFAKSLLPIIDFIGDTLNASSEPLVK